MVSSQQIIEKIVDREIGGKLPKTYSKRAVSIRLSHEMVKLIDIISARLDWSRAKTTESILVNVLLDSKIYIEKLK